MTCSNNVFSYVLYVYTYGLWQRQLYIVYFLGRLLCLLDSNEVWSDKMSDQSNEVWSGRMLDQRIRREPNGLSCICLVDCESDHDVRSIMYIM